MRTLRAALQLAADQAERDVTSDDGVLLVLVYAHKDRVGNITVKPINPSVLSLPVEDIAKQYTTPMLAYVRDKLKEHVGPKVPA